MSAQTSETLTPMTEEGHLPGAMPVVYSNHPSTDKVVVNTRRHTSRERLRTPGRDRRLIASKVSSAERLRLMNEATARAVEARSAVRTSRALTIRADGKVGVGITGIGGTLDAVPTRTPTPAETPATGPDVRSVDSDPLDNTAPAGAYVRMVDERARTIVELALVKKRLGRIPQSVMDEATSRLSMSSGHVRCLVRDFLRTKEIPVMDPRPRIGVPDMWRAKTAYFHANGNAALAYDLLDTDKDLNGMSLRTFQRVVNEWDPTLRAAAREGYRGMVAQQMFNQDHIPFAGYAYGMDHTFLPIRVIPDRGYKPVWVWLTTCIDLYSRVVLSYRLSLTTPNTATILDVFTDAVKGWTTPEGQFIGGKPQHVRSDRGADFISHALNAHLLDLDVERQFTNPYSSWENGRTERLNGTIDKVWAPTVPGFYKGGADEHSRRAMKTGVPDTALITFRDLDDNLGEFLGDFNNAARKSLGGVTPIELWTESLGTYQPGRASDDQLVAGLMTRVPRTVQHYGVEARGGRYQSADLARLKHDGHRNITLAYHNHDHSFVYLMQDGALLGKAYRGGVEPANHRYGVLSMRRAQVREMRALMRSADRERAIQEREAQIARGVAEKDLIEVPDLNYTVFDSDAGPAFSETEIDVLNGRWAGEEGVPTTFIDSDTNFIYDRDTGELVDLPFM